MVRSAIAARVGAVPVTVTAKLAVASGEMPLAAVTVKWKVPTPSGMKLNAPVFSPMVKLPAGASEEATEKVGAGLPLAVTVKSSSMVSMDMVRSAIASMDGAVSAPASVVKSSTSDHASLPFTRT